MQECLPLGDLTEEVYMQPPPRYPYPPDKVCKLYRALYGLNHAFHTWFSTFSAQNFGFSSGSHDSALFIRKTMQDTILLPLYVDIDDTILTRDDLVGILQLKHFISDHFEMKDLGCLNYLLGIAISSCSNGYFLSQAKYAHDLLARTCLTLRSTTSTPLERNARLTPLVGTP